MDSPTSLTNSQDSTRLVKNLDNEIPIEKSKASKLKSSSANINTIGASSRENNLKLIKQKAIKNKSGSVGDLNSSIIFGKKAGKGDESKKRLVEKKKRFKKIMSSASKENNSPISEKQLPFTVISNDELLLSSVTPLSNDKSSSLNNINVQDLKNQLMLKIYKKRIRIQKYL